MKDIIAKKVKAYLNESFNENRMEKVLLSLRENLINTAQVIYNEWEQDEEGIDEFYGSGGICDDIADAMCKVINEKTDYGCFSLYNEYDCHTAIYVHEMETKTIYKVDIPPYVYEIGTGYNWKKIKDVSFNVDNVEITEEEWEMLDTY